MRRVVFEMLHQRNQAYFDEFSIKNRESFLFELINIVLKKIQSIYEILFVELLPIFEKLRFGENP